MDNKEKYIQEEVDKTMRSLDDRQRLHANPWLFSRIESQLKSDEKSNGSWSFFQLLQPAIMCCLLLLNIYTAYTVFSNSSINEELSSEYTESEYGYMADQSLEYYIPE